MEGHTIPHAELNCPDVDELIAQMTIQFIKEKGTTYTNTGRYLFLICLWKEGMRDYGQHFREDSH